jgi:hypothetical protein
MKRNFALINQKIETTQFLDYETIDIGALGSIINYSVDNLSCGCLEYEDLDTIKSIFESACLKLKPKGIMTIYLTDTKKLMSAYVSGAISSKTMLETLNHKKSLLSVDDICSLIDVSNFKLLQIDPTNNLLIISLQRISL